MAEKWRDVIGREKIYEVSSIGGVRRKLDATPKKGTYPGRILCPTLGNCGYPQVGLTADGVLKYQRVHRLVALAFIPNPDGKPQVNHIDGDKCNNAVGNLEWATSRENLMHAYEIGLMRPVAGSDHHLTHLTEKDISIIKSTPFYLGVGVDLSRQYGVDESNISRIRSGKTWKHVRSQ